MGPQAFYGLLGRFGSAGAALEALPSVARRGGRPEAVYPPGAEEVSAELAAAQAVGARVIASCEPDYPPLLSAVDGAPPLIFLLGDPAVFARPTIAIVGTRNASLNGRRLAERLAADLGAAGYAIVSGLARGIDTAAHSAALPTGTAAVLAGGVDVVYPEENAELYAVIVSGGAVIAEMPPGTRPQARHFPSRNRLISGASQGAVVVEAALRSGAMITARCALDQGREVLAVPGSPLDPRARGPNDLIRQGAVLVETADDVLEALTGVAASRAMPSSREEGQVRPCALAPSTDADIDAARGIVAQALSPSPATVDELVRSCQVSPAIVTTVLLEWELAGRLERLPGNRVSLVAGS